MKAHILFAILASLLAMPFSGRITSAGQTGPGFDFRGQLLTSAEQFVDQLEGAVEQDIDREELLRYFTEPVLSIEAAMPPSPERDDLREWLLENVRELQFTEEDLRSYASRLEDGGLAPRDYRSQERLTAAGVAAVEYLVASGKTREDMEPLLGDIREAAFLAERTIADRLSNRSPVLLGESQRPVRGNEERLAYLDRLGKSYPHVYSTDGGNSARRLEGVLLGLELRGELNMERMRVLEHARSVAVSMPSAPVLEYFEALDGSIEDRVAREVERVFADDGTIMLTVPSIQLATMYESIVFSATGLVDTPWLEEHDRDRLRGATVRTVPEDSAERSYYKEAHFPALQSPAGAEGASSQ